MHPVGVAENKSNSLPTWNLYSNFMPLFPILPLSMDSLRVQTTAVFSYFYEMVSTITSVKVRYQKCIIFFWCQHVCISACLPDIISSSSAKTKLKSFSLVFHFCVPVWNCIILLRITPISEPSSPVSSFFSFRSFPESSTILDTEEDIRTSLYVSYLDVTCATQFHKAATTSKNSFYYSFRIQQIFVEYL